MRDILYFSDKYITIGHTVCLPVSLRLIPLCYESMFYRPDKYYIVKQFMALLGSKLAIKRKGPIKTVNVVTCPSSYV